LCYADSRDSAIVTMASRKKVSPQNRFITDTPAFLS